MKNIAIFASGEGSNAEAIARYFTNSNNVCVKCVLTNRKNIGVHTRMENIGIPSLFFPKEVWTDGNQIVEILKQKDIDFIILAGFLAKIENPIIHAINNKIINIHPSLLPKYGGNEEMVALYIKFNKLANLYVIVVSFHKQEYPMKYQFK